MKKNTKSFLLGLLCFTFIFTSCNKEDEEVSGDISFSEFNLKVLDNLSNKYPAEDLTLQISKNEDGSQNALFGLIGQSKEAVELGMFAANNSKSDGTTCDDAHSCGQAILDCLNNGQNALIGNGACVTRCVTCVDKE